MPLNNHHSLNLPSISKQIDTLNETESLKTPNRDNLVIMNKQRFNCRRYENKVVVITGATSGIGLAIAERLALEGASLIISSRNQNNVDETVNNIKLLTNNSVEVYGKTCHVGESEDRRNLIAFCIKKFGRVDVLISNVGVNPAIGSMLNITKSHMDKMFDVNVKAGFEFCKLVVPYMKKSGGSILFTSSIAAYMTPGAFNTYGITKSALSMLTQALASEVAVYKIRVNSIVPGTVEGPIMSRLLWDKTHPLHHLVESAADAAKGVLKRFAKSFEIAASVAYLCSDDASFVTGENHLVTGGMDARL